MNIYILDLSEILELLMKQEKVEIEKVETEDAIFEVVQSVIHP